MRALIITNKVVFPALDGGALAMQSLCEILKDLQYKIDLIAISKNNNIANTKKMIQSKHKKSISQTIFQKNMQLNIYKLFKSILLNESYQANRFYDIKINRFLQDLIDRKKYHIIIFESIFTTVYLNKLKIHKSTKTILRAHNVEHKIWEDLAHNNQVKKPIFLWLAKQIENIEINQPKSIDYIFTLSQKDEKYFKVLFPKKTHNIPVNFEANEEKWSNTENSIFHLGAMDWKPNVEGMNWFLKQVKPLIEIKNNIKIYIAGKNMPTNYITYQNKNTIIQTSIQDAKKYIQNKGILFVPLLSGSGIRIKILEAMSLGVPVISTSIGAEGIPYINQKNIMIADHPIDFANAIHTLIENPAMAKKIGNNGRTLIKRYFAKNSIIKKWKKIVK